MATRTKAEPRPNRAFQDAVRGSLNQMAARLAREAAARGTPLGEPDSVRRHLRRIQNGEVGTPTEPYLSLICEDTGRSAYDLFGCGDEPVGASDQRETFSVTSHKFVATYLGPERVEQLSARVGRLQPASVRGLECTTVEVLPGGDLYLFPFGAAIFHIVEQVEFAYVAELARWRKSSYDAALAWASEWLSEALGGDVEAGYVFSVYWLERGRWSGESLSTAVKLLSVPKLVLCDARGDAAGNAEAVEERLLRDGDVECGSGRIVDFGMLGVSLGFASWSAVAYHPVNPTRALAPADLVETELLTQSVWCYCRHVLDVIEAGDDPEVGDAFGWRYLRAMRSKAMSPGAQESGQSLAMRRAIFETSHLDDQVTGAIECLR